MSSHRRAPMEHRQALEVSTFLAFLLASFEVRNPSVGFHKSFLEICKDCDVQILTIYLCKMTDDHGKDNGDANDITL